MQPIFPLAMVTLFLGTGWVGLVASVSRATDIPQRVILVLADDLGYGDLGCYGARDIQTPQIDRMAREGMRFTDFSAAAPLCTPSRVAIMTGRYPGRVGLAVGVLRPNATGGLAHSETTLGDLFKGQGYATGCIGKWHLGFLEGMRPLHQGFDHYFGVLHNLDRFETVYFEKEGGMPILRGEEVVARPADPALMTSIYTEEALSFIDAHRDHPFFLYLGHAMPHLPLGASPAFLGRSKRGLYGDVVEELDASMGRILDRLRSLGLDEKTLVILTSDNGPERNSGGEAKPLSGTKHTVYEGGVRVPLIVWGPGTVPADRTSHAMMAGMDLWPTLASLIGVPQTSDEGFDGHDCSPVWRGVPDARSPRHDLYLRYGQSKNRVEAYRRGKWKLHLANPPLLFDLEQDLAETNNLADRYPRVVAELIEAAKGIRASLNESVAIGN